MELAKVPALVRSCGSICRRNGVQAEIPIGARFFALCAALLAVGFLCLAQSSPVASQSAGDASPAAAVAPLPGTWTTKAPLPAARAEVAAVALDGKLHVLGGTAAGGNVGTFHDTYDPTSDSWSPRAPLPQARDQLGVAISGGKIYAFGGFAAAARKDAGAGAFEYDPASDTWRTLAPMKTPRGSVGAAAIGGKIHVMGGRTPDGKVVQAHDVYDPQSGAWSEAAPLPVARDDMAVVAVDGKIHVIGGRAGSVGQRTGLHEVFDPVSGKWTSAAPLPTPRAGSASVYYRGMILVLGGEQPSDHTFADNEGYDPETGKWTTLAPLPHGRHGFAGAAIGDDAYFAGGALDPGSGGTTDQLIVFHLP
jgi:Kelch motif